MGKIKVKADELIASIYKLKGNVKAIARDLDVSRQTIYNRLGQLSTAQEALAEARKRRVGEARDRLAELVESEDEHVAMSAINSTIKNYDPDALRNQGVNVSTKEDGSIDQININLID